MYPKFIKLTRDKINKLSCPKTIYLFHYFFLQVFAVVEEAGTILMNDGEELDSWSVIINGHVEITYSDGTVQELHLGDRSVNHPALVGEITKMIKIIDKNEYLKFLIVIFKPRL